MLAIESLSKNAQRAHPKRDALSGYSKLGSGIAGDKPAKPRVGCEHPVMDLVMSKCGGDGRREPVSELEGGEAGRVVLSKLGLASR